MTRVCEFDAAAAPGAGTRAETLSMTEPQFRLFYAETAPSLKAYLTRVTGQSDLSDDLLQESYYRMLRAALSCLDPAQRKNYLYRVATNLARDHFRRASREQATARGAAAAHSPGPVVEAVGDLRRVLDRINPRDRELVWLAYVEGASHREIAGITGLKESSIRPLLFKIRRKLAGLLGKQPARA